MKMLRTDIELNRDMISRYGDDNAKILKSKGIDDTNENRYFAHFFGVNDAIKVINSDDIVPIQKVISPSSYNANPHLHGKTVGEVKKSIKLKFKK